MAIKEGLSYDKGKDVVEGFVPGEQQLANHAIVFMVRGLTEKWKQPVGYFLSSGPMSADTMKLHLLSCLTKLNEVGLKVVVIVADQGSNNRSLFQVRLGATADKPFFSHNNSKIYVLFDPPHLLKNVRNNLKKHGFEVGENDILWEHIVDFYTLDSSKPVRLAPKLTKKHIELPPFAPLRVNLAAQVLSHSVATGLHVMAQWDKLPGILVAYMYNICI